MKLIILTQKKYNGAKIKAVISIQMHVEIYHSSLSLKVYQKHQNVISIEQGYQHMIIKILLVINVNTTKCIQMEIVEDQLRKYLLIQLFWLILEKIVSVLIVHICDRDYLHQIHLDAINTNV